MRVLVRRGAVPVLLPLLIAGYLASSSAFPSSWIDPLVFADTFESGNVAAWSLSLGALPLAGFGVLSGDCGVLSAANLDSPSPSLFVASLDFGTNPYDESDFALLTPGAQTILDAGQGGSGDLRDAFAFEVLARCELAALLKTRDQIVYLDGGGAKASFLTAIRGFSIGVTTGTAYAFPPEDPYTVAQAQSLLTAKLASIAASSANVAPVDAWRKQILPILAYAPGHAASIETAWAGLAAGLRGDTIVLVIVTEGDDDPLY